MGRLIEVEFDPVFKPSQLSLPIAEPTESQFENNAEPKKHEIDQTKVYGVQVPLIVINDIFIDFDDVIDFSLKSVDVLPTVKFTVRDKYGLIETIQTPGMDNTVRIDIVPRFDNAYKKIELVFYINNIKLSDKFITLSGLYKYPKLTDDRFEALGEINTYDLFYNIAKNTELGFATNVLKSNYDKRYVYCDYKSYIDILNREINYGGNDNEIYDYWVNFWNYLVLADIKERYNAIDTDDQMMIWVAKQTEEINENNDIIPIKTVALFTNHPSVSTSELYIKHYDIINKSGSNMLDGSDHVYSIYENNKYEYLDYNVIDGDVKKDIFTKFDYIGEVYSDHNYLKQKCIRKSFMQKINSENIKITLKSPLFGVNRGDRLNIVLYKNNDMIYNKISELQEQKIINNYEDVGLNIPLNNSKDGINNIDNGFFMIDRAISGQYLITACELNFINNQWQYILTLNRPANQKPEIIKINE